MALEIVKGRNFSKKDGSIESADAVFANHKVVCFYFSAHWCPPCRGFTPILKDFYEEIQSFKDVTVVFVSSDRDAGSMKSYFESDHGDYFCLPFEDRDTANKLKKEYDISGIPCLVIVKGDGTLITKEGRGDVQTGSPTATREKWIKS